MPSALSIVAWATIQASEAIGLERSFLSRSLHAFSFLWDNEKDEAGTVAVVLIFFYLLDCSGVYAGLSAHAVSGWYSVVLDAWKE